MILMRACWFYKIVISHRLDSREGIPGWVDLHVDGCEECARFHRGHRRVIDRLSIGAADALSEREAPPFLHSRIMSAVRRAEPEPVRVSFRPAWVAGIAASVLLVGALSLRLLPEPGERHEPTAELAQSSVEQGRSLAPVLSMVNGEKLLEMSRNLDQPLEAELQFVMNDARSAIETLANNFLPGQMIAQSGLR
jgi:anti-sigma factor RsiW